MLFFYGLVFFLAREAATLSFNIAAARTKGVLEI